LRSLLLLDPRGVIIIALCPLARSARRHRHCALYSCSIRAASS
jgi:hypothetical protein